MARIYWVALEHWGALSTRELARCVEDAHALTYAKLTKKTRELLALPGVDRRKVVAARRKVLEEKKLASKK